MSYCMDTLIITTGASFGSVTLGKVGKMSELYYPARQNISPVPKVHTCAVSHKGSCAVRTRIFCGDQSVCDLYPVPGLRNHAVL
jgi:hypothetical protein